MRVLWIVNQATPSLSEKIGIKIGAGGGWMSWLSEQIADSNELIIIFPISERISTVMRAKVGNIVGIGVPIKKGSTKEINGLTNLFQSLLDEFKPNVIHIWGTEYIHSYHAIMACRNSNYLNHTIVSIQGLVSIYAKHFWAYASSTYNYESWLANLLSRNSLHRQYTSFLKRGVFEEYTLRTTQNVIGRTDWDRACVSMINPSANYYSCNETLRETFYKDTWNYEDCERYSIFVSQGNYPIKGLHLAIEALNIVKKTYKNVKLYVTGRDIMSLKNGLTTYEKYIKNLIIGFSLEDNVFFTGILDERRMKDRFLKSHVFISASSIENSPNSVGEAMLLGVPTVASDVGGVKNMLIHETEGFIYPADEPYMLAFYIKRIFESRTLACQFSANAKQHAAKTHNPEINFDNLINIYNKIM